MIATSQTPASPSRRSLRLAWAAAFLLTVALLGAASAARSAGAAAVPAATGRLGPPAFAASEECEADEPDCEEELEACEEDEEEAGECEEEAEEGAAGAAPSSCLLTRARPRVTVAAAPRRLRLDVAYVLTGPAAVAVSLRSSGARGAVSLPAHQYRLTRSGSLHRSFELSEIETERALAARRFTVRLRVQGVPWSCHRYDFRQLGVRHGGAASRTFTESPADLRAGR